MSETLFITTLKKNWILLLIFFGVLAMYITVMISMYNPEDMESLLSMIKLLPSEFMKAFRIFRRRHRSHKLPCKLALWDANVCISYGVFNNPWKQASSKDCR
jgi:hypothetical protein